MIEVLKTVNNSYYPYKGYSIKLRSAKFEGFGYHIYKQTPSGKMIKLREKTWNFIKAAELLQKAQTAVDTLGDKLEEKYNRILSENPKYSLTS